MGMFDYETSFNPNEQQWQRSARQAEQARQELMRGTVDPFVEKHTGYVSPKAQLQRMASQTDLSDGRAVQKTYNAILAKNPAAAKAWIDSVMPTLKANIEQQKLAASAKGSPIKAKEAHLQAVRNRFIKAKGAEEGERAFGAYLQAQGTQMQGTIPQGYRMSPEGTLEIIPGGPQEQETKVAEEAMKNRQALAKRAIGVVKGNLKDALKFYEKAEGKDSDVTDAVFGISGKAASVIPGTNRKSMESVLETIKANIGFDRLQQMREASPTGGALGQVAVQELVALQATLGNLSLDQEPEQFFKTVKEIEKHYDNMLQVIEGKMPTEANPLNI
jgi:hypothetical protein